MKRYLTYLTLALLAAGGFSCSKQQEQEPTAELRPIEFRTYLQEGDKITPIATTRNNAGGNFAKGYMLGGAWTTGPFLENTRTYFLADRAMNANGTPVDPTSNKVYWKADGATSHTFFAYTPNPEGTPADYGILSMSRAEGISGNSQQGVFLKFKQPDAPAQQIDLLTADVTNIVVNTAAAPVVNLYFRHRLAKVSLRVFGSGATNLNDCKASITYDAAIAPKSSINLNGYAGLYIVRLANGLYEVQENRFDGPRHKGTHLLGAPFTIGNSQTSSSNASLAGSMILIPQTLAADGWASVEIEYTLDGSTFPRKASVSLPQLGLISPSREYIINMNILEQSQSLTVTGITLQDWVDTSGEIDYLPITHTLSLSASAPTAEIPQTGSSYTINVVSNRPWFSEANNVEVTPSTGGIGTTPVTIKVAANNDLPRSPSVKFTTVGETASVKSLAWRGNQASTKANYVEIGALQWAVGNLVADGPNGARIGSTDDTGLYFQFGSLIGWKGGATGDGTGRQSKSNKQFYVGTTFLATNEVAVMPLVFTTIDNIGTTWPKQSNNQYYFGSTATTSGSIHSVAGITNGALASSGVGDPCRYYLGGAWRLPTFAEVGVEANYAALAALNGYKGRWYAPDRTSGWDATNAIWLPAAGFRLGQGMYNTNQNYGHYWASDVATTTHGKAIYYHDTKVPLGNEPRDYAYSVRCVRNK